MENAENNNIPDDVKVQIEQGLNSMHEKINAIVDAKNAPQSIEVEMADDNPVIEVPLHQEEKVEKQEAPEVSTEEKEDKKEKKRHNLGRLERQKKQAEQALIYAAQKEQEALYYKGLAEKEQELRRQTAELAHKLKAAGSKAYLSDALQSQDPELQAKAIEYVIENSLEKYFNTQLNNQEQPQYNNYPQNYQQPPQYNNYEQADDQTEDIRDNFEDWVQNNKWYNTNQYLRKDYDDILVQEMNKYSLRGQENEIGSREFLDHVKNELDKKYGIGNTAVENAPQPKPQTSPSSGRPQNLSAAVMSNPTNAGQRQQSIRLNPQESFFAQNVLGMQNIKNPQTGKLMTNEEKIRYFAELRAKRR